MVYCVKRFTVQHSVVIPIFAKDMRFSRLLDVYGVLLSDRKRDILDYYYNEDYSLAEIAEQVGISRQGVRDSVKKSEDMILELESKLKLVEKSDALSLLLREIREAVQTPSGSGTGDLLGKIRAAEKLNDELRGERSDPDTQE